MHEEALRDRYVGDSNGETRQGITKADSSAHPLPVGNSQQINDQNIQKLVKTCVGLGGG